MLNKIRHFLGKGAWRYIISFSSIVMFVILAMGLYLYSYYFDTIYHDFAVSNQEFLSTVVNRHENDLKLINSISTQIAISDTATPFLLEKQPEKSYIIQKQIRQYKGVSQFFSQIYILFHEDHYLYNESTSIQLNRFQSKGLIPKLTSPQQVRELLYESKKINVLEEQEISGEFTRLDLSKDKKAVLYFVPIHYGKTGTLLFVTGSTYYDTLMERNEEEQRVTYLLKDHQVMVSRGELPLKSDLVETYLLNRGNKNQFEIKENREKFLLTVQQGENGFEYCTIQSLNIFQDKISSGQWPVLLFILLCTIPATILISILSIRLNRVVGNIKALLQRDGSKGDDFDAIKSGILELMGHNLKLSEIAEESIGVRRAQMIRNFVRGSYSDRETVIEEGKKVGLFLDKTYYKVALIGSRDHEDERDGREIMFNLLAHNEKTEGCGLELLSHEQLLFLIFSDESEAIENMIGELETIGRELYKNFAISSSNMHEKFDEISVAYLEANTAYDNRFLVGNSKILQFSDVMSGTPVSPVPDMYMGSLKYAVCKGNEQAIDSAINDICTYLQSGKQSLFNFRILYNEIIHVLIYEWNPKNIEFQKIYNIFALSECLSIQDFNEMLKEICVTLLGNRNLEPQNQDNKMQQAVTYMRENYSDSNLNMSSLAEYLEVSSVTLSVEFKESIGMSPSDYLTLLRIERAKELLKNTDLSVNEVSGAVGYFDVPGFIRRFKKYIGKTPAQFRKGN